MKNNLIYFNNCKHAVLAVLLPIMLLMVNNAFCQAELEPWGNITGIRKHGQLFDFESSIKVISKDGTQIATTAHEKQRPHYKRNGDQQEVTTAIDSLFFKEVVKDESAGKIKVFLQLSAHADTMVQGIFFCITLPSAYSSGGLQRFLGVPGSSKTFNPIGENYDGTAKGVQFYLEDREFNVYFDEPTNIRIRTEARNGAKRLQLYIAVAQNGVHKGDLINKTYTIKVSGDIDKTPVNLAIDTLVTGRVFDGLGGNFRLQNPKTDQQVIDYCLRNLHVAWGRVEMPWRLWQPKQEVDPTLSADSGKLNYSVKKAMLMAHRLDSIGMPLILTAWFPPDWAIEGKVNFRPVKGIWGNPLRKDKMDAIYKSIADYIIFLKKNYGFEPKLFSFNESDLGINIRLTGQEHDDFIKGCGAYFAGHGLQTKMLLGDNSDATTYNFIVPALNDPAAKPYIGAVSFHSWRGWDKETLQKWADAATKLNLPLLVGEGSIDAAAYSYPDIFQEQTYALQEINLYTRLLAICQPASILQWQLTADYSPLIGGGIFGNDGPLHPGQRFWNLKQLSITPKGLFSMPISCDRPNISCAALGDRNKGVYAVHLVNNGTTRKVTLTGLPAGVKSINMYTTSKKVNMKETKSLKVENGEVKFKLPTTGYTTLISE
jgi:hypothetical protein